MEMHGGVARDGWNPLGIRRKKLIKEGVAGTALITSFYVMDDESTFGLAQHEFTLEVRVDGREPYELQGLFRVPVKKIDRLLEGATVPVKVHPTEPDRVAIDWDQWDGTLGPGRADAGYTAGAGGSSSVASTGGGAVIPDATKAMMLNGWIDAVRAGGLNQAEFEQALNDAVKSGMITEADAQTARGQVT
jgi:hypothetical protein